MKVVRPDLKRRFKALSGLVMERGSFFWETFSRLSHREKRYLIAAGVVLSLAFVEFGIVRPIRHSLLVLREKISVEEKKAVYNLRNVGQKPQVDVLYLGLLESIGASGASSDEIRTAMLHDVELSARSHNISLTDVKPQVSTDRESLRDFYLRAQAEGKMEELIVFFTELVKMKKLYYIESLKVTPHPDVEDKIKANISIGRAVLLSKKAASA